MNRIKSASLFICVMVGLFCLSYRLLPDGATGFSLGIQNGGSDIGGAVKLNCSTNTTCAVSGGTVSISASSSAGSAFNAITSGTNTSAAMVVGSGSTLDATGTGTILHCTQDVSNNVACAGSLAAGTGATSGQLILPGKTSHSNFTLTVDDSNTATTVKGPNDSTAGLYMTTSTSATPAAGCAQFTGTSTQTSSTGVACGSGGGGTIGSGSTNQIPYYAGAGTTLTAAWSWPGGVWQLTPPNDAIFSWVNQGSASVTVRSWGIHLLSDTATGANLRLRCATAPATPYTITTLILIEGPGATSSAPDMGIALRDSVSGRLTSLHVIDNGQSNALQIDNWTNPTTFSSAPVTWGMLIPHPIWLRMADDGTNVTLSYSANGSDFVTVEQVGRTSWLTNGPNGNCFYVDHESAPAAIAITLLSWVQT